MVQTGIFMGYDEITSGHMIFNTEVFFNIPDVSGSYHSWWPMGNYPDPNRGITWYNAASDWARYDNPIKIRYTSGDRWYISGSPSSVAEFVINDGLYVTANGMTVHVYQHIGYHPPIPLWAYPLDITSILVPGVNSVFFQMYSGPYAPDGLTGGGDGHSPIYIIKV